MPIYVVHVDQVHGNRCTNENGVASVYYTNQAHDVLAYCAPRKGTYNRAVAFEAENMNEAVVKMGEIINRGELHDSGE